MTATTKRYDGPKPPEPPQVDWAQAVQKERNMEKQRPQPFRFFAAKLVEKTIPELKAELGDFSALIGNDDARRPWPQTLRVPSLNLQGT